MDNLLIFFDNTTPKINNVIINHLKRMIIYDIVYKKIYKNIINDVYIFKTRPSLIEIKLTDTYNNIENIDLLLNTINNVIYKEYGSYGSICFKTIIDKIIEFEKITKKNKIFIICSVDTLNSFTEQNLAYIKNLFDIFNSDIKLINISTCKLFKNINPKIQEYLIDIKNFSVENFNILELFSEENSIEDYISLITLSDSLNLNNNNKLMNYLLFLGSVEKKIITNKNNKLDNLNYEFVKKILSANIEYDNNIILNILKSFQKSLNNLIFRYCNSIYTLPINKLEKHMSNSYIKYILEFYEIIYPKIYKKKYLLSYSKNNSLIFGNDNTSIISLKDLPKINIDTNNNSSEYLKSTLSLTNWIEEFNNLNPFGFLIKYRPNKLSCKGILDIGSSIVNTYPNMVINSITTNWIGLYDYYQIILSEYDDNQNNDNQNNDNQNNDKDIFDISNFNITDGIQGDGNVLLLIYINHHHWELVKSIWSYHLSFINNSFEPEYNKKMDNIYFLTFLKIFSNLKNLNQNINKKSLIRLFCYLLRTCIQILIDNKFLHSIKKDYSKYLELVLDVENSNKENSNKGNIFSDWIIRLIQLIISNGCEQENLEKDLSKINTYIFNKFIISKYKMDYWEMINDSNTSDEKRKEELKILKNIVLENNMSWLFLNHDLVIINKIIKSIYSIKGFNQFIKTMDSSNGLVSDELKHEFESELKYKTNQINISTISKIIDEKFSEQFNLEKYHVDISKFTSIQYDLS